MGMVLIANKCFLSLIGWKGSTCSEVCSNGMFGQDCKQHCECENESFCNPFDGACTCTAGFKGNT